MSHEEIIDSYLTGRMNDAERAELEQKINADPNLKSEFALQKAVVEGIRKARAAQLKSMLAQVPITSATIGSGTTTASLLKIASAVLLTGAVGTGVYLFMSDSDEVNTGTPPTEQIAEPAAVPPAEEPVNASAQAEEPEREASEQKPGAHRDKPADAAPVAKPKLDIVDLSADTQTDVVVEAPKSEQPDMTITESELEVEVGNTYSKKYSFHYQFRNGKLLLYGPFDKSLYEILEIHHGDSQSTFLYYKDLYYMLDRQKKQVTPLTAIENQTLIEKLKEFRKE
jgi:anti-sigma factor RsiW